MRTEPTKSEENRLGVPLCDLSPQIAPLHDALREAFDRVLGSGTFILGTEVASFESEIAGYLGAAHAVSVNSGTDALTIALRSLDVGPGDDVITTSFSFFATSEAIIQSGATPIFVDIEPDSFNISASQVKHALTEHTKAILPVHLYGHPADLESLQRIASEHGLFLIEDVAQALGGDFRGRKLGTTGDAGAFSFFPSKNLGAFGDGGLIATDDPEVAAHARALRAHGARRKYHNEVSGYNSRLDELQAAFLRVKLPWLDEWNGQRREAADRYRSMLEGNDGIEVPSGSPNGTHVFHQFTIRVRDAKRDAVKEHLSSRGVGTHVYYPVPIHRMPMFSSHSWHLPETDRAASEVLSLPMFPGLTRDVQEQVVEVLLSAVQRSR